MAYIESFIYFWIVAVVGCIFLVILSLVIAPMIKFVISFIPKYAPDRLFGKHLFTFLKKKHIKFGVLVYFGAIAILFISQINTYLIGDRPYKQAKAYAIVGDFILLWQSTFVNYKTIETPFFQASEYLQQKLVLDNINKYVPKDDGEREIWFYKFHLFPYARSMYAPIDDKTREKGWKFTDDRATYKSEFITMVETMYTTMQELEVKPMKDKRFSQIERYISIVSMAPYYEMYHYVLADLKMTRREFLKIKFFQIVKYKKYKNQFYEYLALLNRVKKVWDSDEELAKAFESMPHIKTAFYWGVIRSYKSLMRRKVFYENKYPCDTKEMEYFAKYYDEWLSWIYPTYRSSFKNIDKKRRRNYIFVIGGDAEYYVAKYICHKKFHSLILREQRVKKERKGEKTFTYGPNKGETIYFKTLDEEIAFYMKIVHEDDNLAKRVRKIQKEQNIGENYGR